MNCCANCFSDEQIKKIIVDNGHIGDCDFCGEKQVPVCSVDEATDISDLISDVLSVYEENERGRPLFLRKLDMNFDYLFRSSYMPV